MAFLPFIGPVFDVVNTVLKRILPAEKMSEAERAKLEQELRLALTQADWQAALAQVEVNKEEAKHASIFVAGWRPFVGWTGGSALAYHFIIQPMVAFLAALYAWELPPMPVLDASALTTILLGMLGLGGMRTYEKLHDVQGKH